MTAFGIQGDADVVVIGGGIVGCAAAYYLARQNARVALLERAEIACEQSGWNSGFIRHQGRDPSEIPLVMESKQIWRRLQHELGADIGWVHKGSLVLAGDDTQLAAFEQWLRLAHDLKFDTTLVTSAAVAELIPSMRKTWVGGLYTASDGHADPEKATAALAQAAAGHGARIYTGCPVESVDVRDDKVAGVRTPHGDIRTNTVVCAAGAWSARLARTIGLTLPRRLVRVTVARTSPAPPITPIAVWAPPTISFRQRSDGSLDLGGGGVADFDITLDALSNLRLFLPHYWKNRQLFRFHVGRPLFRDVAALTPWSPARRHPFVYDAEAKPRPNEHKVRRAHEELVRLFPSLHGLKVVSASSRYIDVTPDALPVLGAVTKPRGFFFATGFSGHGFAMGPIVGRVLAELIMSGRSSLDIAPFRFSRFAEGAIGKPRSAV